MRRWMGRKRDRWMICEERKINNMKTKFPTCWMTTFLPTCIKPPPPCIQTTTTTTHLHKTTTHLHTNPHPPVHGVDVHHFGEVDEPHFPHGVLAALGQEGAEPARRNSPWHERLELGSFLSLPSGVVPVLQRQA